MLLLGAGKDRICLTEETRALAARIPNAAYVEIPGAGHEILMERDLYREQFWTALDAFLHEKCPGL